LVVAEDRAAHCRFGWEVLSSVISFYGNGTAESPMCAHLPLMAMITQVRLWNLPFLQLRAQKTGEYLEGIPQTTQSP
jgi:hypothetical protein